MDGFCSARAAIMTALPWPTFSPPYTVGIYIAIIITVGLADVATFAFVGITLALLGERRLWVLIAYPALFSVVVVSGLKAALTYEVSTLLL